MTDAAPGVLRQSPDLLRQFDFAGLDTRSGARAGCHEPGYESTAIPKSYRPSPAKSGILCRGKAQMEVRSWLTSASSALAVSGCFLAVIFQSRTQSP
jgi:hypothetical protein